MPGIARLGIVRSNEHSPGRDHRRSIGVISQRGGPFDVLARGKVEMLRQTCLGGHHVAGMPFPPLRLVSGEAVPADPRKDCEEQALRRGPAGLHSVIPCSLAWGSKAALCGTPRNRSAYCWGARPPRDFRNRPHDTCFTDFSQMPGRERSARARRAKAGKAYPAR